MTAMKLIGSLASPYVRKVRIVMAEKKLDYQLVLEDVWGSDAILKMNPLGKVPCLVMEGQDSITGRNPLRPAGISRHRHAVPGQRHAGPLPAGREHGVITMGRGDSQHAHQPVPGRDR